jgi:recombination protein RecT
MSTNGNNLPAQKPQTKAEIMQNFFERDTVKAQMQRVLDDNIDSFVASVIDLYTGDTYLQNCHPELVVMQALKAATLKLPVIKSLGFAYIVPFKSGDKYIPTMIIGYKGLIQLAIRTNQYRIINADVVYEGEYKTCNKLTGEFDLTGEKKSDRVIGYFAHFELKSGFSKTIFMTRERVDAHAKKFSKSYNTAQSPWKTDFDSMALKTTIRGLFSKWGALSVEMQSALTDDDADIANQVMDEIQQNGNKKPLNDFPPINTGSIQEGDMATEYQGDNQSNGMYQSGLSGPGF